jgi:AmmeMemoRadiSam system protein B
MPFGLKNGKTLPFSEIKQMDQEAIQIISNRKLELFDEYLEQTHNTICGREPIRLAMRLLSNWVGEWNWLHYDQSGTMTVSKSDDSSVSYVAGVYTPSE